MGRKSESESSAVLPVHIEAKVEEIMMRQNHAIMPNQNQNPKNAKKSKLMQIMPNHAIMPKSCNLAKVNQHLMCSYPCNTYLPKVELAEDGRHIKMNDSLYSVVSESGYLDMSAEK